MGDGAGINKINMNVEQGGFRSFINTDVITARSDKKYAPAGVRFRPMTQSFPFVYNSLVYIEVDNKDVTGYAVDWTSVNVSNILTRQADTASFSYLWKKGFNAVGTVGSNVKIYDSGSLIFQGIIIKINYVQESARLLRVRVECVDYTRELDNQLVNENFSGQSLDYVIRFIMNKYAPQFTLNNLTQYNGVVNNITFPLQPLSKCLADLADMFGYDWYVDQYKDLHFGDFSQGALSPFSVTDTNGSYEVGRISFDDDISQLRNSVYIRGGVGIGASVTSKKNADGVQKEFACQYHFSAKPTVTNAAASQTVGVNNVDNVANFQCMWDPTRDIVIFAAAPSNGNEIDITGTPENPIRLYLPNPASIQEFGQERQILVIDNTIITFNAAVQRAQAELLKYAETVVSGQFVTRTKGLAAGQTLSINSVQFVKNNSYIITQVDAALYIPTAFEYTVTVVSTKLFNITDLLIKMLRGVAQRQIVPGNESFDPAQMTLETAKITETSVATAMDNATIFVAGPYTPSGPSDKKRQFLLDGSPLG